MQENIEHGPFKVDSLKTVFKSEKHGHAIRWDFSENLIELGKDFKTLYFQEPAIL